MDEVPGSVGELVAFNTRRDPTGPAVEFLGNGLNWGEFEHLVNRLASALLREGVGQGSRFAHLGRNSDVMLAMFFAAARIGAVFVPLNWRLAGPELDPILSDAEAVLLFVTEEFRSRIGEPRLILVEMTHGAPEQGLTDWLPKTAQDGHWPRVSAAATVVQLYTSGTTGHPKGVLLSAMYFLDGARMFLDHPEMAFCLRPSEAALVTMPLFHVGGLNFCFVTAFQGRGLIILDDYDPDVVLSLINQGRVALATGAPTMLQGLLENPAAKTTDFTSLRYYIYGAAPMPPTLLKQALEVIDCSFASMYGQTESSGITYLAPSDHQTAGSQRMLSVGRPLPGVEMRIIGPDGADLPVGAAGEIVIRSPQMMSGYWKRPQATQEAFLNGWLRTGDGGYLDADGYLFLKDRVKDMIISGGENIYPAEIEFVLYNNPDIRDVAVIGVPDERWGEVPKAYVVAAEGATLNFKAIREYAAERLAKYKVPRQFEAIDALPRNAAGKVLKRDLRLLHANLAK